MNTSELIANSQQLRSNINTLILFSHKHDPEKPLLQKSSNEILDEAIQTTNPWPLINNCIDLLNRANIDPAAKERIFAQINSNPLKDQAQASNKKCIWFTSVAFTLGLLALAASFYPFFTIDADDDNEQSKIALLEFATYAFSAVTLSSPIGLLAFYLYNRLYNYGTIDSSPENFKAWMKGISEILLSSNLNENHTIIYDASILEDEAQPGLSDLLLPKLNPMRN